MYVTIHESGTTRRRWRSARVCRVVSSGEFYLYDSQSRYVGDAEWRIADVPCWRRHMRKGRRARAHGPRRRIGLEKPLTRQNFT